VSEPVDLVALDRKHRTLDDWVVVIEATTGGGRDCFDFGMVQELLAWLQAWQPSGLFNPDRYAIQLHVTAVAPDEALRCAVTYHEQGIEAVGLTRSNLARAEVLTLEEFESAHIHYLAPPSEPAPAPQSGLISNELYRAARALLRVKTPADATSLLVEFVTAVGGSVNVGPYQPVPGMIAVDISVVESEPMYAVTDQVSVAGMIFEQSLAQLVGDARFALHVRAPLRH
jgi:hypothetical protein